jgi:hypothetical protein
VRTALIATETIEMSGRNCQTSCCRSLTNHFWSPSLSGVPSVARRLLGLGKSLARRQLCDTPEVSFLVTLIRQSS